jgi:hypothetical protein
MPALVAGIHVLRASKRSKTWMAGPTPGHDVVMAEAGTHALHDQVTKRM